MLQIKTFLLWPRWTQLYLVVASFFGALFQKDVDIKHLILYKTLTCSILLSLLLNFNQVLSAGDKNDRQLDVREAAL